jgi:urease accessory protein
MATPRIFIRSQIRSRRRRITTSTASMTLTSIDVEPQRPGAALPALGGSTLSSPTTGSPMLSSPTLSSPTLGGPELLRLLQLSSSLCPIGAFAFSQGLEQAVERAWVSDEASAAEWLQGLGRHGLSRLDLPLLLRAHAAWQSGDAALALGIAQRLLANREARELWEQERDLGQALAAVLVNLKVPRAAALREARDCSYVVAYALGAVHFGIGAEHAALGYAFAWSEQQASAAARLVPLGHMAVQRVLSQLLAEVPDWVRSASVLRDEEVGSLLPGLALAAAWHETQYSRLFRS